MFKNLISVPSHVNKQNIALRLAWFVCGILIGVVTPFYGYALFQTPPRYEKPFSPASYESKYRAATTGVSFLETNANRLISIGSETEVVSRRKTLSRFIWGSHGLPRHKMPNKVEAAINDQRYAGLANLKQINKLTVSLDWGLTSTAYHFIPAQGNGRLVIYHQGHDGDFIGGIATISFFLEKGFAVIGLSMPLEAPNNQPTVDLKRFGTITLTFHDQLKLLEMKSGHPVQLFLTPVIVALNYAEQFNYKSVYMTGISGGGWTTTMCAAVDTRITRSYPIAGSLPVHLRADDRRSFLYSSQLSSDWGDYEQTIPELYKITNYLELYLMGSQGTGRKQLQILNKYDACCFAGDAYRTYEGVVRKRVRKIGPGDYAVSLDMTHEGHIISDHSLGIILEDINAATEAKAD